MHPDTAAAPEAPETAAGRQLATFVRGNLSSNFSTTERVSGSGLGLRSTPSTGVSAPPSRPEMFGAENGTTGRSRLAARTGNADRMRLIVEENGRCVVISNPGAGRGAGGGAHDGALRSRTPVTMGRPRSSEGWERGGDPAPEIHGGRSGRLTGVGPMSPVGGARSVRSSSGSLPRLGRSLVSGTAVCTSPSLPGGDLPPRPGPTPSPGVGHGAAFWWKAEKQPRDGEGSQSSFKVTTSTPQRATSKDEDG